MPTLKKLESVSEAKGIWIPVMRTPQGEVELTPILPKDYLHYSETKKQLYKQFEDLNLIYYKKL